MKISHKKTTSRIAVMSVLGLIILGVGAYIAISQHAGQYSFGLFKNTLNSQTLVGLPKGYIASRPPDTGCSWADTYRTPLGLEFVYEDCGTNKDAAVNFAQSGNKINLVYTGGVVESVLEVFQKASNETIEQAIVAAAGKDFTSYQKAHCIVESLDAINAQHEGNYMHLLDASKEGYVVVPDATYQKKIDAETPSGDIPTPGCGDYGFNADSLAYFEFHPKESNNIFIYVGPTQDTLPFDEQSIRFTK